MLVNMNGALASSKRRITFDQPAIAKVAAMCDDVFRKLGLTVVCLQCGETPQMANHPLDALWKMTCSCTERVLVNPSPSPHREKILS